MTHFQTLHFIEIEPILPAQSTIIWLHGLGADGNDFVPIIRELDLPTHHTVRFIFPHAKIMPVTINNGYEMRAWYDIYSLTDSQKIDKAGISHSVTAVTELIEAEVARGISSNRIVLAGFSQGAAIAITTGIRYSHPLAGIVALSGYLPLGKASFDQATPANKKIPIFIAHGTEDLVVPYVAGEYAEVLLRQKDYPTSWHSYPMPHTVCAQEIKDIGDWIKTVLITHQK